MASQKALDEAYMNCAVTIAALSRAKRKKVGAILVAADGGGIIAEGFNGTPSGFDNNCEDEVIICEHGSGIYLKHIKSYKCSQCKQIISLSDFQEEIKLKTKPECLHAESNCITKVAKSTNSSKGSTLYTTLSPCFECAKLIIQSEIKRVVYKEKYDFINGSFQCGIALLQRAGIECLLHKLQTN